jgi:hypothetical protein
MTSDRSEPALPAADASTRLVSPRTHLGCRAPRCRRSNHRHRQRSLRYRRSRPKAGPSLLHPTAKATPQAKVSERTDEGTRLCLTCPE